MEKPKWRAFAAFLGVPAGSRPVQITLSAGVAKYHHPRSGADRRAWSQQKTIRFAETQRSAGLACHCGVELLRQRVTGKKKGRSVAAARA